MSRFSECLNTVRTNKGLNIVEMARLAGVDVSTMSKWLGGERKPKSVGGLSTLLNGMKLNSVEKRQIVEAFEMDGIGSSKYQSYRTWFSIFEAVRGNRPSTSPIKSEFAAYGEQKGRVVKYDNKVDLMRGVQSALSYAFQKRTGKLRIRIGDHFAEFITMLHVLMPCENGCEMELVLFVGAREVDMKNHKLEILREMISLWRMNCSVTIYVNDDENEFCNEESWIITEEFVFQFRLEGARGLYSSESSWVRLWVEDFDRRKKLCRQVIRANHVTDLSSQYHFLEDEKEGGYSVTSVEMAPCLSFALTKEILEESLRDDFPLKKIIVEGVSEQFEPQKELLLNVNTYFSLAGLREFMDTGRVSIFPHADFYRPIRKERRIQMLQTVIDSCKNGNMKAYAEQRDWGMTAENVFWEVFQGNRPLLRLYAVDGSTLEKRGLEIRDREVIQSFLDFLDYLKGKGYVYHSGETILKMEAMLEQYQ